MVRYKRRKFSIRHNDSEDDGKRIHFQRLHHSPKKLVRRPFWWLAVMLILVVLLLLYLNGVR